MKIMDLTPAEAELIEALRSDEPGGVMVMLKERGGEWVVSTSVPPFTNAEVGVAGSFSEAWQQRCDVTKLTAAPK